MIFEASRKALNEHYGGKEWNNLNELHSERDILTAEQTALYTERKKLKSRIKEIETIKGNVDLILGNDEQRTQKPFVI